MTKKNGFLKVAGLMMSVMMLATCVLSGTMANYQTKKDDIAATATAAKWEIQLNDVKLDDEYSTPLAFEVYENNGGSYSQTADDEVKGTDGAKVIAPGTWGVATITVKNAGEVNAKISAAITEGQLPTGMKIYVGTKAEALSADDFKEASEFATAADLSESLDPNDMVTLKVAYDWPIGTDGADNDNAGQEINLGNLALTATQVD